MSQPLRLYRLQQIDSQFDQVHSRLREIEIALSENALLLQAQEEANNKEEYLKSARNSLRRSEENVQDQRIKIEETETTLYGGKLRNPKELQDLQNESASLKRYLTVLEDRQLEAMLIVEEAEAAYKQASITLYEVRAKVIEQQAGLKGEQSNLIKTIERLATERQAALKSIVPEDLQLYDQLRTQRRGLAVAKVVDKSCTACGATLTAALVQSASSSNQIIRCSSCGRILFVG